MGAGTDGDAERARTLRAVLTDQGRPGLGTLASVLPAGWLARSSTGYDGVVRLAPWRHSAVEDAERRDAGGRAALTRSLLAGEVPDELARHCAIAIPAMTRVVARRTDAFMGPQQAIAVVEAVTALTSLLEACRMLAARDLATEAGNLLLAEKDLGSPDEMARSVRDSWEATCRALSAEEVAALTGQGRWHTREVAAIGLAPPPLLDAVLTGLRTGVARWPLVAAFWRRCWSHKKLSAQAATEIAAVLFGDDLDSVVVERITPDGQLSLAPWPERQFHQALEREATRREAQDPSSVAAERAEQHRRRTAFGCVDDDGSGQIVITGDAASTSACVDRLHVLARRARAAGDLRSENQLRSDIARALLLHGTLPLPELADDVGLITPYEIQDLVQVLAGAPRYELQVVVPWDALGGHAAVASHGCGAVNGPLPTDGLGASGDAGLSPAEDHSPPPHSPPDPAADDGVGRLLGRFPRFLTKAEILAIAGGHGVVLSRLLVDPADGRCIERSITAYRPDATMRAQIRAADVFSRFPGSTLPVRDGDLDHVTPYLLDGATSERNLQGLDRTGHVLKTQEHWSAQMDQTRNVTWTSFFGRLYTTRTHDYRQYLSTRSALPGPSTGRTRTTSWTHELTTEDGQTRTDQRYLASLLTYAALCARHAGARLEKPGDDPASDPDLVDDAHRALWVRHTRADGKKVSGARPGTPLPEQFLTTNPEAILDAAHWTDAFTDPGGEPDLGDGPIPF